MHAFITLQVLGFEDHFDANFFYKSQYCQWIDLKVKVRAIFSERQLFVEAREQPRFFCKLKPRLHHAGQHVITPIN